MTRLLFALLAAFVLAPTLATAEAPKAEAPLTEEQRLVKLRNSGTYKQGLERANSKIEHAYDLAAVKGSAHWEAIHSYYLELAKATGCKTGKPHATGPVKACHKPSVDEPQLLGDGYKSGRREITAYSKESLYSELVGRVLFVVYDYGYVQGMKHGIRLHNDELRWAQTFYKSCMARVNDAQHEPTCARASTKWSEGLLEKLRAQIESHGLPAGKKPK